MGMHHIINGFNGGLSRESFCQTRAARCPTHVGR